MRHIEIIAISIASWLAMLVAEQHVEMAVAPASHAAAIVA